MATVAKTPDILSIQNKYQELLSADLYRKPLTVYEGLRKAIVDYGGTLQEAETILRKNNCYTYLIARNKSEIPKDLIFALPSDPTTKTYYLFISTRSAPEAMQELLAESTSYQDNFAKLKDTGFLTIKPKS
jgi:hypothetical protein